MKLLRTVCVPPAGILLICLVATGGAAVLAQEKPAPGSTKSTEKSDRRSAKSKQQVAPDAIPGYTIHKIQGFNVIINNEVLSQDVARFQRKPLEVLDMELSTIVTLLPADAVNVLRNLLIWVEWDEKVVMSNGRAGTAEAVYYGGHQLQLLKDGKHPLKAKSVTVLSMLALTREHQPGHDSGRCVLLHEMAHAVHNELLGRNAEPIRAAYAQALQRNLYEKHLYAATNEQEFFAELTCAYFDQLHYYPKNRSDLEKHDPITFRLMQEVWGKRPIPKTAIAKNAESTSESESTKLKLASVPLGRRINGPALAAGDLDGRPVLLVLWNARNNSSLSCLSKVQSWDDELRHYGLVTIGEHQTGQEPLDFEKEVKSRKITFPITDGRWTNRSLVKNFNDFPLCVVFNHRGESVFQGSPFDAEQAVRMAVGEALTASLGEQQLSRPLELIAQALREGKPPQTQLTKLSALARAKGADGNELATALLERITSGGRAQLNNARERMESDPVAAFIALEQVAAAYKGSPLGQEAVQTMGKLRPLKPVQLEFQARQGLAIVKKLESQLSGRAGSFDPTQPKFRMQNAGLLSQLQNAIAKMAESWPDAQATRDAVEIGRKYAVVK